MKSIYVLHQILTPNVGLVKGTDDYAKTQLSAHPNESDINTYLESEGYVKTHLTAGVENAPIYQKYVEDFEDTVNLSYTTIPFIRGLS